MTTLSQIKEMETAYLAAFPDERERIKIFSDYISRTAEHDLYNRKNFDGHITTSAFIIDRASREILLLRHKSLSRWLQPGGHVEQDATLLASALREAEEETGISAEMLQHIPLDKINALVPLDIDPHYIPANPKKGEDGHYHHDVRYLFVYDGDRHITYNEEESTGLKWVPFAELKDDATFGNVIEKISQYI